MSEEPIPPCEDDREIRHVLAPDDRVVDAVHARGDQHAIQEALDANRQAHVAVLKERVRLKHELVDGNGQRRCADQQDLHDAKSRRQRNLAEMKAECTRHIEIRIDVMHHVKTPEERQSMIGQVPAIETQVQQQYPGDECNHGRQRNPIAASRRGSL